MWPWNRPIKSVLLVDFDNIGNVVGFEAFIRGIPRWLPWLEDGEFDNSKRKRSFVAKRMYWNKPFEHYRDIVEEYGFEALLCASRMRGRSTADMAIALHALAACYDHPQLEECVVLAVDSDYEGLLNELTDRGRRTVIVAEPGKLSAELFPRCADTIITVGTLQNAFEYGGQRRFFESAKDRMTRWWIGASAKDHQLKVAADIFVETAKAQPQPTAPIGRKRVLRLLIKEVKSFKTSGPGAYLSCGNYESMIEQIAANSNELTLHENPHGTHSIRWRPTSG